MNENRYEPDEAREQQAAPDDVREEPTAGVPEEPTGDVRGDLAGGAPEAPAAGVRGDLADAVPEDTTEVIEQDPAQDRRGAEEFPTTASGLAGEPAEPAELPGPARPSTRSVPATERIDIARGEPHADSSGQGAPAPTAVQTVPHASGAARPAPPQGPRVGTVVWGLVVLAIGLGILAAAAGARIDVSLAAILLLGGAGVALVAGSIVSSFRRRGEP
ncbi:hypothetical protein [Myceligenerans xiligouense]|uniref:Uncharacterized protein n=1 Tax=Myceligenerans xiligouense TaxID=253184 RepID=A0A3N4ZBE1_9MICO|nr:hypothetical protein [Myceligenerans xiligouense]RPF22782.1 hypothetical protein EDD34_3454 [Myceligenerans xiligouense]